jgi:hypothetical protein
MHTQDHDHDHQVVPSDPTLRANAIESLLVEKGLVDPAALDALAPIGGVGQSWAALSNGLCNAG